MAPILKKSNDLKRVTIWVNKKQWSRLNKIAPSGNRSKAIRWCIDKIVSKELALNFKSGVD
jgi:hypothetical protein